MNYHNSEHSRKPGSRKTRSLSLGSEKKLFDFFKMDRFGTRWNIALCDMIQLRIQDDAPQAWTACGHKRWRTMVRQ